MLFPLPGVPLPQLFTRLGLGLAPSCHLQPGSNVTFSKKPEFLRTLTKEALSVLYTIEHSLSFYYCLFFAFVPSPLGWELPNGEDLIYIFTAGTPVARTHLSYSRCSINRCQKNKYVTFGWRERTGKPPNLRINSGNSITVSGIYLAVWPSQSLSNS